MKASLGTATVRLDWDMNANEPAIDISIELTDNAATFGTKTVISGLASALERAAREVREHAATTTATDDED